MLKTPVRLILIMALAIPYYPVQALTLKGTVCGALLVAGVGGFFGPTLETQYIPERDSQATSNRYIPFTVSQEDPRVVQMVIGQTVKDLTNVVRGVVGFAGTVGSEFIGEVVILGQEYNFLNFQTTDYGGGVRVTQMWLSKVAAQAQSRDATAATLQFFEQLPEVGARQLEANLKSLFKLGGSVYLLTQNASPEVRQQASDYITASVLRGIGILLGTVNVIVLLGSMADRRQARREAKKNKDQLAKAQELAASLKDVERASLSGNPSKNTESARGETIRDQLVRAQEQRHRAHQAAVASSYASGAPESGGIYMEVPNAAKISVERPSSYSPSAPVRPAVDNDLDSQVGAVLVQGGKILAGSALAGAGAYAGVKAVQAISDLLGD